MGTLELLWELQEHDNNLKDIKLKLEEISNGKRIKELLMGLEDTENRLNSLEKRLEANEYRLNKNNLILRDLDYKLKETESDLYEGNILDIKQLSYLDKERDTIKGKIDEKEIEILQQMEEMDSLKEEFIRIQQDFKQLKSEYIELIEKYKFIVEDLKTKAQEERREKDKISRQIQEDILVMYAKLKNTRGNALAEIIDNRCSGCNVLLPTIVIDKLKDTDTLIYCENCGRILYPNKSTLMC